MANEAELPGPRAARDLIVGLGRAFGGAFIFGLPMLMTNELWEIGASVSRPRLALLLVMAVPLLVGVAHRIGFEPTFGWREDLRDAFIALGVGLLAASVVLGLFNLLTADFSADALAGRVAVQAVPAALGALLARSQFGGARDEKEERAFSGYFGTLFMMTVGALFLSLNIAPTEETIQVAYTMSHWHAVGLLVLTVGVMHAFVYGHGVNKDGHATWWSNFRYTLVGYVLALAISLYVLWTFGRVDGVGFGALLLTLTVLAFPAGLGAAATRLLL